MHVEAESKKLENVAKTLTNTIKVIYTKKACIKKSVQKIDFHS